MHVSLSTEMSRSPGLAEFQSFDRQIKKVECILRSADKYNDRLTAQINNLKQIVRGNENALEELEANDRALKFLLEEEDEVDTYDEIMPHFENVKKELFVTLSLVDGLESDSKANMNCQALGSESSLSQEINGLDENLVSVGKNLMLLRKDKTTAMHAARHLQQSSSKESNKGEIGWTTARPMLRDNLKFDRLAKARKETKSMSLSFNQAHIPLSEFEYQRHTITRVEKMLAAAEQLNCKSKTLMNVKNLTKLVLKALIRRRQMAQTSCLKKLQNKKESLTIHPDHHSVTRRNFRFIK